jgi:hypothetical protein
MSARPGSRLLQGPCEFTIKSGFLKREGGDDPASYVPRKLNRWPQRFRNEARCRNQAATFLRVRFVGAAGSGAFGLRPSPIVLANAERAAA